MVARRPYPPAPPPHQESRRRAGGPAGMGRVAAGAPVLGALPTGVYDQLIATTAARYGFDPALVKAVIKCESQSIRWRSRRAGRRASCSSCRPRPCSGCATPLIPRTTWRRRGLPGDAAAHLPGQPLPGAGGSIMRDRKPSSRQATACHPSPKPSATWPASCRPRTRTDSPGYSRPSLACAPAQTGLSARPLRDAAPPVAPGGGRAS